VLGGFPVDRDGKQLQLVAVQDERLLVRAIAAHRELCLDDRVIVLDVDVELDGLDGVRGRAVILEVDGAGLRFAHEGESATNRCTKTRARSRMHGHAICEPAA
jgi:hypothetical protein